MKSRWAIFFVFLLLQNFTLDLVRAGRQHDSHIAHILAAGLIVQMLTQQHQHKHHHHGHHHGHESRNNAVHHPQPHQHQPHHYQESRIPQPQYPMPAYPVPVQPLPWNGYGYAQQPIVQDAYGYAQQSQVVDPGLQQAQASHYQQQMPILPQSSPYVNSHGELKQHVIQ